MLNPYQGPASESAPLVSHPAIVVRAVLLAPIATFVIALILAAMAGIFIALFAPSLLDDNGDTTLIFDVVFFAVFVWPPYLLCGYLAGKIAGSYYVHHALYAGCVYLVANLAMSLPWETTDPFYWSHVLSFALIVPLALLGGKLVSRS